MKNYNQYANLFDFDKFKLKICKFSNIAENLLLFQRKIAQKIRKIKNYVFAGGLGEKAPKLDK